MVDPLSDVVFSSDGQMEAVHPRQLRQLVSHGIVFHAGERWRTELTANELAVYVAGQMAVCDFCSRPDPVWEFPCADFVEPPLPGIEIGNLSVGAWGACQRCSMLIRAGKWERLAKRAVEAIVAEHPAVAPMAAEVGRYLRDLHRQFMLHRQGPPVRAGQAAGDKKA
jgi:hypothetical protein